MAWCRRSRGRRNEGEEVEEAREVKEKGLRCWTWWARCAGVVPILFLWKRACELRRSCADGAVLEIRGELGGIVSGGEAGLAGANHGEGFVSGEMRQSFFESACESCELRAGSDAQNGLAETEDT